MTRTDVPASVWPVAQTVAGVQRRGRYLPASTPHPGKMLPALARTAIERYSDADDLVVDPMCGIGTTVVEAIHLGRRAIGVDLEQRWASVAAANAVHARSQGASGQALVMQGDARQLGHDLLGDLRGQAALILTSPPYGPSVHGRARVRDNRVEKWDDSYASGGPNLAHLRPDGDDPELIPALQEVMQGCHRILRPGGHLVMTARPFRRRRALVDLPGQLVALAAQAGLQPAARHVALLAGLRDGQLVPRASFFQLQRQRSGATPRMLIIAHEDVLVFRRPTEPPRRRQRQRAHQRG